jgi:hypothetical protein
MAANSKFRGAACPCVALISTVVRLQRERRSLEPALGGPGIGLSLSGPSRTSCPCPLCPSVAWNRSDTRRAREAESSSPALRHPAVPLCRQLPVPAPGRGPRGARGTQHGVALFSLPGRRARVAVQSRPVPTQRAQFYQQQLTMRTRCRPKQQVPLPPAASIHLASTLAGAAGLRRDDLGRGRGGTHSIPSGTGRPSRCRSAARRRRPRSAALCSALL